MSKIDPNNNANPPKRSRKRFRWWYTQQPPAPVKNDNDKTNHTRQKNAGAGAGEGAGHYTPQPTSTSTSTSTSSQDKLKRSENERRENEKQVEKMEKQLHEYFHKTNTNYTYVDNTGIYKFSTAPPPPPPPNPAASTGVVSNPFMNITFNPFIPSRATTQNDSLFSTPFQWPSPFNTTPFSSSFPPHPVPGPEPGPVQPTPPPTEPEITDVIIHEEINHIDDLIALCDKYPLSKHTRYNINMSAIHAIRQPLVDLKNMVGMDTIKRTIIDQILYYLQELHKPVKPQSPVSSESDPETVTSGAGAGSDMGTTALPQLPLLFNPFADPFIRTSQSGSGGGGGTGATTFDFKTLHQQISENIKKKIADPLESGSSDFSAPTKGDFMHTVIYGPPGSGKTEVAKIIGRIFSNLGILTKKTFKKVSRNDLVAGYLGQTAIKTKDIIKASMGGVLFIDEAYSLGNSEKRDSFAKECVDTLCEALSEYKHNWMVIIAGYEKELNDCFFSLNEGLNSRFTWRFKLDTYKPCELKSIYEKQVRDFGWTISAASGGDGLSERWFSEHMDYFTTYGRDMETLFTKTKIAHSRRVFCLPRSVKTEITMSDLENGFKLFIENPEVKERVNGGSGGSYMKTLYL
jgi:hypothetical protein